MNDLLATLELSLDKMIKSGESEREQASLKTMIDKKRLKIQNKEAENRDKLAELERKINEFKERVKIEPLADHQAANLATDKKVDP